MQHSINRGTLIQTVYTSHTEHVKIANQFLESTGRLLKLVRLLEDSMDNMQKVNREQITIVEGLCDGNSK